MVMIALLLNLSVYGLVFNLTFGFEDALVKGLPSAKADTASSTVTVKNAPPSFTGHAIEVISSTSTTPVNVGNAISFAGSSTDAGLENFYLLVCKSGAVATTTPGGLPSCVGAGNQLCVSSATTTTGGTNTCTYSNVTDPGAETQAWDAFVCDDHVTQPFCSPADQGYAGSDSNSPFYVNRQPYFNSALTISDNKNPGALFTFGATTTERDITGGNDVVTFSVCQTNSYSTTTGCAVPWCSATTTANGATPVALSCQASTSVPWTHGASTTYSFLKDSHGLQATSSINITFTTNDVSPVVGSAIDFNSGAPVFLNLKGAASTTIWATTTVTDNNGGLDINYATSTMYWATTTNTVSCSADNNKCYKVASTSCLITGRTAGSVMATVACSAQLAFYAVPTVASGTNPHASTDWRVAIGATDDSNSTSTIGSTPIEMGVSLGVDVAELSIAYGTLVAGANTGTVNSTTTVVSLGNAPLSNMLSGTWMSKGANHIAEDQQQFSMNNFNYGAGTALSSTTPFKLNLNIPRPVSSATTSSGVYWGMALPAGIPSGDYSGINTFIAILGDTAIASLWN